MLVLLFVKFGLFGVKEFEVFDLLFIFVDYDVLCKVINGLVGKQLMVKLEFKGICGLGYWDNGFKFFLLNLLVKLLVDLKGKKLCIQFFKVFEEQVCVFGGLLQVMVFFEVYQVLQMGVVDGIENLIFNFYMQKMYEVQKYLMLIEYGYLGYVVIVNKKFWDGLLVDVCVQLDDVMEQVICYVNQIVKVENESFLEVVKKSGKIIVYMLIKEECLVFKKVLVFVY